MIVPLAVVLALSSQAFGHDVPKLLTKISSEVFPDLRAIAKNVHDNPEISTQEFYAHDQVVNYFTNTKPGLWNVTPHSFGEQTSWRLEYENRPDGFTGKLPAIGFMAEYDALIGEGHACGHQHILLNAITSASILREAVERLNIPAHIVCQGTPDEENTAGKYRLDVAGAFDASDIWFAAHPAPFNWVSPMQARINGLIRVNADTHYDVVAKAYHELEVLVNIAAAGLPGTSSSDNFVEDVGLFSENIVQTQIGLGVGNVSLATVQNTLASLKAATAGYASVNFTINPIPSGAVSINLTGPGGHASEGTKSPLLLSVELFRSLSGLYPDAYFFLPFNATSTELDLTVSCRTRYTNDLPALQSFVAAAVNPLASSITWDRAYPALEVTPVLGDLLIQIMATPDFNETWIHQTIAPAASDASFVQKAVVDPTTHIMTSAQRVVHFPNFNVCAPGQPCPFPHEPAFEITAKADYAYLQTEKIARALAQTAVGLLTNSTLLQLTTAIIH